MSPLDRPQVRVDALRVERLGAADVRVGRVQCGEERAETGGDAGSASPSSKSAFHGCQPRGASSMTSVNVFESTSRRRGTEPGASSAISSSAFASASARSGEHEPFVRHAEARQACLTTTRLPSPRAAKGRLPRSRP